MPKKIIPITKKYLLNTRKNCVKEKIIILREKERKRIYRIIKSEEKKRREIQKKFLEKKREVNNEYEKSLGNPKKLAYNAARVYLISAFPVLGDIYKAYMFTKFAYKYVTKFQSEYERNKNIETAIMNTIKDMTVETTINYIIENKIETFVNLIWAKFKSQYRIDIKNKALEEVIKGAIYDTILEVTGG